MSVLAEARSGYLAAFDRAAKTREPHWLGDARRAAIRRFEEIGFPGPKNEDWKYTGVTPLVTAPFHTALGKKPAAYDRRAIERRVSTLAIPAGATRLVFVDGMLDAELSRDLVGSRNLAVRSLATDLAVPDSIAATRLGRGFDVAAHGFAALNTAFAEDGAVVRVGAGHAASKPIHVVFFATGGETPKLATTRSLIVCEQDSSSTVIEHWLGEPGVQLANGASEIVLEKGATLHHVKIQDEAATAYHVARIEADLAERSVFDSCVVTMGAALSRTEIAVRLSGPHAECRLNGLYVVDGERHADHHTVIDHESPETKSAESYKGVLDESSRGVFTGRVVVRRDSQKVEARQTNRNLLLSEGAVVETRPQLEIYADDVQCSHGATVGRLDENAMFYLRQRGLDRGAARGLLTWAFASEVLTTLPDEKLRAEVAETLRHRIAGAETVEEARR
jgi:Fe-S cluster assembly protein SufD